MDKRDLEQAILARYDALARQYSTASCRQPASCNLTRPIRPKGQNAEDNSPGVEESDLGCARMAELVSLFPGETVLDIGSGPGLEAIAFARRTKF